MKIAEEMYLNPYTAHSDGYINGKITDACIQVRSQNQAAHNGSVEHCLPVIVLFATYN